MGALVSADGLEARFAASLQPELFYALQALSEPESEVLTGWQRRSLDAFPRRAWPLDLPAGMWPAVPDLLPGGPTLELAELLLALREVPTRRLQERFLGGLLHVEAAVVALLDEGQEPARALAKVPRKKREWLAFAGLFPLEPGSPATRALLRVVKDPEGFRSDLVAMVEGFWEATFAETWAALLPALQKSAEEKGRLFASLTLPEFLRHTLLPVEFDRKKRALCALRGGAELSVAEMGACTFTPSVFNTRGLWTVQGEGERALPWFPYLDPDAAAVLADEEPVNASPAPDVALIFRALGDATRFAMASLIGRQPRTSVELASILSVTKPTVSHHIHVLRSAGLIHEVEHGSSVLISLNRRRIEDLSGLALDRLVRAHDPIDLRKTRKQG